jgi:Na+/alanine symporter
LNCWQLFLAVGTDKQSMPFADIKVVSCVNLFIYLFSFHVVNAETVTNVNVTAIERVESPSSHDLQVYGIVVTIILCFIVFGGVKMINRVAPAILIPVLFSLFSIFIGIFLARKDHPVGECNFVYLSFLEMTLLTCL